MHKPFKNAYFPPRIYVFSSHCKSSFLSFHFAFVSMFQLFNFFSQTFSSSSRKDMVQFQLRLCISSVRSNLYFPPKSMFECWLDSKIYLYLQFILKMCSEFLLTFMKKRHNVFGLCCLRRTFVLSDWLFWSRVLLR